MDEKLCIIVQLCHHTSKLGPVDISQVIYIEPLEILIYQSLWKEGQAGKLFSITHLIPKGTHMKENTVWILIYLLRLCSNRNNDKLQFVIIPIGAQSQQENEDPDCIFFHMSSFWDQMSNGK